MSSPVFYTNFAGAYRKYSSRRQAYVTAVDDFVATEVGSADTIIDIGSGDGIRASRLAKRLGASCIALVDNSDGMIRKMQAIKGATIIKADISNSNCDIPGKYDVVLCLWNVLGHVAADRRDVAMKNLKSLLSKSGVLILDVNNRYNGFHYGIASAAKNILKDLFLRRDSNGDFDLYVDTDSSSLHTRVHIFNLFEIEKLIRSAGLTIIRKAFIDYENGNPSRSFLGGQLVYKLERQ